MVETTYTWQRAEKEMLAEFGKEYSSMIAKKYQGMRVSGVVEVLRKELDLPLSQREGEKILTEKIRQNWTDPGLKLFPGTRSLIENLSKKSIYKLAVASSSPKIVIEAMVARFKLAPLFNALVSGEEVRRGKPAPDIFLRAAEVLKVAPNHCVVLEDAPNGIQAAKIAGMKTIAVVNQTFYKSEDFGNMPDMLVHSLEELNADSIEKLFG